jgi:hypothetical protein
MRRGKEEREKKGELINKNSHREHTRQLTNRNPSHQNQPHHLRDLVEPLLPAIMQIPGREPKDDHVPHDGRYCPDVIQPLDVRDPVPVVDSPHAPDRQRRRQPPDLALQHENAIHARQREVDEHEHLAQPAEDPIPPEVLDESQEGGVVRRHREEGHHPDDEEVVWHQRGGFDQADGLDSDADYDLLV